MKLLLIVAMLTISGCDLLTARVAPTSKSLRLICDEANGVVSIFTGRVKSLVVVASEGVDLDQLAIKFGDGACSMQVGSTHGVE